MIDRIVNVNIQLSCIASSTGYRMHPNANVAISSLRMEHATMLFKLIRSRADLPIFPSFLYAARANCSKALDF